MSYLGASEYGWKARYPFSLIGNTNRVQHCLNMYGNRRIDFPNAFPLSGRL